MSLRIAFGLLMCFSAIRFWYYGWIEEFYILPEYHFSYPGLDWIQPLPGNGMYLLFALMALSALGIALGAFYRFSAVLFLLCFTWVELIDKTFYLNHYYFVSLMALLLALLPVHKRFSVDVLRNPSIRITQVPHWMVLAPKLQLAIVYFFAGLAKLHGDWLLRALPLKLWLPGKAGLPLIGGLLKYELTAIVFSWFGAIYDLCIPFLLWWKKTSIPAFAAVVVFHVMTWSLFPIGVFPWVMILATTVFLPVSWHEKWLTRFESPCKPTVSTHQRSPVLPVFLSLFFLIQVLLPMRYLLHPGDVRWHEQGFRFSWRVMLVEKNGQVQYRIRDLKTGREGLAYPEAGLIPLQAKQMSFQPDMILQYAHKLAGEYKRNGVEVAVYADSFVSMNGRDSRRYINPDIDLARVKDGWGTRNWILPYED